MKFFFMRLSKVMRAGTGNKIFLYGLSKKISDVSRVRHVMKSIELFDGIEKLYHISKFSFVIRCDFQKGEKVSSIRNSKNYILRIEIPYPK